LVKRYEIGRSTSRGEEEHEKDAQAEEEDPEAYPADEFEGAPAPDGLGAAAAFFDAELFPILHERDWCFLARGRQALIVDEGAGGAGYGGAGGGGAFGEVFS
jgi:hypothetical protein